MPLLEFVSLWECLRRYPRPLVLYGMGDGADKTLDRLERLGIAVQGVFASDGFVRGQRFRGFSVRSLEEIRESLPSFTVLLCFASQRREVLQLIEEVESRHPLFAPDFPVAGDQLFDLDFLEKHCEQIQRAEGLWADQLSRRVFWDVINYKISGKLHYLRRCTTPREEVFRELIRPGKREIYVDAGAYNGDTVAELLRHTEGRFTRILALEPDRRNFRKLQAALEPLGGDAAALCLGAWDRAGTLGFSHTSGRQAAFGPGGADTAVETIDNLTGESGASIIKLDVEGAERKALLGCTRTIARCRPRLMVAAYHRSGDLWELPLLLHRLRPDYRLHLRHHPYVPAWETNLYAL